MPPPNPQPFTPLTQSAQASPPAQPRTLAQPCETSALSRAAGLIVTVTLTTTITALAFGLVPLFYRPSYHERFEAREQRLNWAALNFRSNVLAGAVTGAFCGIIIWAVAARKSPPRSPNAPEDPDLPAYRDSPDLYL